MLDIPVEDNQITKEPPVVKPEVQIKFGPAADIKPAQIKVENKSKQEKKEEIQIPKNIPDKKEAIIEPGIEIESSLDRKVNYPLIFTVLAAMLVFGSSGFFYYQKSIKADRAKIKQMEIADIDNQLTAKDIQETEARVISLGEGIQKLEKALTEQLLWTELFSDLGQNTLQAVSFSSFSIDGQGNVKIEGITDKYSNVAKLMVGLKQSEKVKKVELADLGLTEEKEEGSENTTTLVSFSLNLEYNLDALGQEDKEDQEGQKTEEETKTQGAEEVQPEVQPIE